MAIEVQNLSFTYGRGPVVEDCSFRVEKGKVYCLLGRNRSGKTTLLRLLTGHLKPVQGQVTVNGLNVHRASRRDTARLIGFVPQQHDAVFAYSVREMVAMGRNPHLGVFARPQESDYVIAAQALEQVGISHLQDRCYMEISGGERQLVFLARALAQQADYYVLDEPTSHLDFCHQHSIMRTLQQIVQHQGAAAIIAMHDTNLTLAYADEVILLSDGRISRMGTTSELMTAANLQEFYGMDMRVAVLEDGKKVVLT